ncbi:radical SAM protein [Methanocaldococcus infernus]
MRYLEIANNEKPARFLILKSIPIETLDLELEELIKIHDKLLSKINFESYSLEDINFVEPNLLDLKIKIAEEYYRNCCFCEHRCYINREKERGFCRIKESYYATEFLHYGEEKILIPSHTIFFCGCNFKCVFCQNWDISQVYFNPKIKNRCLKYDEKKMAKIIEFRRALSKNVNFVGGEPTPHLLSILKTLKYTNVNIPVVWNSNMYLTLEALNLLDGVVDLYLTDFKFGNNECAERLSKIRNYFDIVSRNHSLLDVDVIVRHLVMPNHLYCCTERIFKFLSKFDFYVNVMFQYRPEYLAIYYKDINRTLTYEEMREALELAEKYKLKLI